MRLASYWIPEMESAHAVFRQEGIDAQSAASQLQTGLDAACARAERDGCPPEYVQDALYATVAWIDELAMSFNWPGAAAWRLSPLQRHYFATTRAGVGFFDRLEALPPEANAVREVYALALVAGFQGQFAHRPPSELAQFRRELLERVAQDSEMAPIGQEHALFPEAYALGKQSNLRGTGPSISAFLLIVVPLLILLALYVYLNTQLSQDIAELIAPLTSGL
ncbi:MAG: DotU family type IV/VI secretion system protein [Alcaligenaceae bacterium]|nr:DotU family type IV/VI secretion system protein [Alcaligenaceae bacterium]